MYRQYLKFALVFVLLSAALRADAQIPTVHTRSGSAVTNVTIQPVAPIPLPAGPSVLVTLDGKTINSVAMQSRQIISGSTTAGNAVPVATDHLALNATGHYQVVNKPPTVSNCGSGATIAGNDSVFQVNIGSGTVTTCQVNFKTRAPLGWICQVSTSVDFTVFTTLNPIQVISNDPRGRYVILEGQSPGADIGCETANVTCVEIVQPQ